MQQNSLFILIFFLISCSSQMPSQKVYKYPKENPHPELFTTINYSNGKLLKVDILSSTVKFSCTKRSDGQPYYWCGIDGDFTAPVKDLPKRLETIFHVQLSQVAVTNVQNVIKNQQRKGQSLTIVLHREPNLDKERNVFWNQIFAFYNHNFCVAFLGLEKELCPKQSQVINIYQKARVP